MLRIAAQYLVEFRVGRFAEPEAAKYDLVGCGILAFDFEQPAQIRPAACPEVPLRTKLPASGRNVVNPMPAGFTDNFNVRRAGYDLDPVGIVTVDKTLAEAPESSFEWVHDVLIDTAAELIVECPGDVAALGRAPSAWKEPWVDIYQ